MCGDGVVNASAGEACDDGNADESDGCLNDCTLSSCGDGVVDPLEECDDGNVVTEACDYGETSCVVCSDACVLEAGDTSFCGDGVADLMFGEICDTAGESATCNDDCTVAACGDAIINAAAGETCDDGNAADGDGCSSQCQLE